MEKKKILGMDYTDKNGNKWSIEKGDWIGYQSSRDRNKDVNQLKKFFTSGKITTILFISLVLLLTIIYYQF